MNRFQKCFDAQKALFASGITRTYECRVEQLDRMARMIGERENRFQEATLQAGLKLADSVPHGLDQQEGR